MAQDLRTPTTTVLIEGLGSLEATPDDDRFVGASTGRLRLSAGIDTATPAAAAALLRACDDRSLDYVGVDVDASNRRLVVDLQALGFGLVEQQLTMTLRRLHRRTWPESESVLAPADADGLAFALRLAADAFDFGRYHADPLVDRRLLAGRYPAWIASIHTEPGVELLVLGPDDPIGFLLTRRDGDRGQLLLGAVDPAKPGPWGPLLYRGALRHLQADGCRIVTAVTAVDNTAVLNVLTEFGFAAEQPVKLLRRAPGLTGRDPIHLTQGETP